MTAESTSNTGRLAWVLGAVVVVLGTGALVWWHLQPSDTHPANEEGARSADTSPAELADAEPPRTAPTTAPANAQLIVLVDRSASMGTVDRPGGPSRYARAAELLRPRRARIEEHFEPGWCHFAASVERLSSPAALARLKPAEAAAGEVDVAAAVRAAIERCQVPDLAGVLLISDGVDDGPAPATRPAVDFPVPIYAVRVGPAPDEAQPSVRKHLLLRKLARRSGGLYVDEADLDNLLAECVAREQAGTRRVFPPKVVEAVVEYQFPAYTRLAPAYTRLAPRESKGDSIRAPVGSQVTVQLRLSAPVHDAVLEIRGGQRLPMACTDGGRTLACRMVIERDGAYRVLLRDGRGRQAGQWPDPLDPDAKSAADFHPIRAVPDRPPTIAFAKPAAPAAAPPGATLMLTLRAEDDYGLSAATFVCRPAGGGEPTRLALPLRPGRREAVLRFAWDLAPLGFRAGSVAEYYAVIADNAVPPQQARTKTFKLSICDPAASATRKTPARSKPASRPVKPPKAPSP